ETLPLRRIATEEDVANAIDQLKSLYNEYSFKPIPTKVTFVDDNSSFESDPNFRPQTLKISYQFPEIQEKANKDESPAVAKEYKIDSHEFKQSWGEKFNTIYHTSIAVIDLQKSKCVLLDKVGVTLCEPFFFKSDDSSTLSIGCVGYKELPYKLGLIYCTNRVSCLFGAKVVRDCSSSANIEPEIYYGDSAHLSIRSPRVYYSNGYDNKIVFLERNAGGAHDKAAKLQYFDMETRKIRTLIDDKIKREVLKKEDGTVSYSDVGPIFSSDLPPNCFTKDGKYILFDSETPMNRKSFAVQIENQSVHMLDFADSTQIIDVQHDWICAIGSSINQLPLVYLGHFSESNTKMQIVDDRQDRILETMSFGMFMLPSKHFENKYITAIWTSPKEMMNKSGPTVIIPHGGPHGHYSCTYYQSIALYNELGLKTCLVNYIGSTGVDQEYVEALLGNVGTSDVQDLLDVIQYMIDNHHADKDRIILNGGSHGGFLVTNISGQHPEMNFLACIARNPVIDISLMFGITDIPDWNVSEALGVKEFQPLSEIYPQNVDEVSKMYSKSPLAHIAKVKVPTMLLLGKEDLRVPLAPGLLYHQELKLVAWSMMIFIIFALILNIWAIGSFGSEEEYAPIVHLRHGKVRGIVRSIGDEKIYLYQGFRFGKYFY
ncbi:acylamino-acid-releasing enzyme-like protein, partial [Euroglyphus maynei]